MESEQLSDGKEHQINYHDHGEVAVIRPNYSGRVGKPLCFSQSY